MRQTVGGPATFGHRERLYISRRTVQTHVAHIFMKLGISSRTQLAAEVIRQPEGG